MVWLYVTLRLFMVIAITDVLLFVTLYIVTSLLLMMQARDFLNIFNCELFFPRFPEDANNTRATGIAK